eukprot:PRCOL_00002963-RA
MTGAAVLRQAAGPASPRDDRASPAPDDSEVVRVLLTVRAPHMRAHASEVALPGGKADAGETPAQTALREAFEEVGVPPERATVLGTLPPLLAKSRHMWVTPVVAVVPPPADECAGRASRPFEPRVCADEVDRVFSVPLARFLSREGHSSQVLRWDGAPSGHVTLHFFEDPAAGDSVIFGLTSAILVRLAEVAYGRRADFEVGHHISSGIDKLARESVERAERPGRARL